MRREQASNEVVPVTPVYTGAYVSASNVSFRVDPRGVEKFMRELNREHERRQDDLLRAVLGVKPDAIEVEGVEVPEPKRVFELPERAGE